jgi:hypothetical protein
MDSTALCCCVLQPNDKKISTKIANPEKNLVDFMKFSSLLEMSQSIAQPLAKVKKGNLFPIETINGPRNFNLL